MSSRIWLAVGGRWFAATVARRVNSVLGVVLVASACSAVFMYLSIPNIPAAMHGSLPKGSKHQVDILVLDFPGFDDPQMVEMMLRPMLMVAEHRLNGQPQHWRIIVSRSGFPMRYEGSGIAQAGYIPGEGHFVVDALAVARMEMQSMIPPQQWAFAMAHEATHMWQDQQGRLAFRSSHLSDRDAYALDPIEIEAFEAGIAVASVLGPWALARKYPDGRVLSPPPSNPYLALKNLNVADIAEVRIRHQWTPLGTFRRIRERVTGI